jgi:hypothetical protein
MSDDILDRPLDAIIVGSDISGVLMANVLGWANRNPHP